VSKLISWKHSFERLSEEYDMTRKKKQALDNLLDSGKISQSTYDSFNNKIDEAIAEIEKQQKELLDKMNSKAVELEQHIKTLEVLLANFEIKHVTEEIDDEVYQREVSLLSTGLEAARQEMDAAKEAINQLSNATPTTTPDVEVTQEVEIQTTEDIETPQPEITDEDQSISIVESEEKSEESEEQDQPETPVESAEEDIEAYQDIEDPPESPQELWQDTEETQETETADIEEHAQE